MPSLSKPVLPPTWPQVLAAMQQSLTQALAAVAAPPAAAAASPVPPWQDALERLDHRLGQLEANCRRAAQDAAATDADLAGGGDALRQWLATAAANRQSLAEWSTREV
jgi:SLT domain-containing protein